jgi:hypothetical protein
VSAVKCSQLSTSFTEKALAFKDRVNKANTCPGKAKWNADEILEAVENIPEWVRGVAKKAEVQKLYDNAKRNSEKLQHYSILAIISNSPSPTNTV